MKNSLWIWGQPGLQYKIQDNPGSREKLELKTNKQKLTERVVKWSRDTLKILNLINKVEIEKMIKYYSIPSVPAKIRRKTNSSYMPVIEF